MNIDLGLLIAIPACLVGPLWMFLLIYGTPEQRIERMEVKKAGEEFKKWKEDNP